MKRITILIITLLLIHLSYGQAKQIAYYKQIWNGYYNQTRLSNKWGLWFDAQLRTNDDFVNNFSQVILRAGAVYYLAANTKLFVGYAFGETFSPFLDANVSLIEHRPWQQFQWLNKYKKFTIKQSIRLEERFKQKLQNRNEIAEDWGFNYRIRYHLILDIPLNKLKNLSFVASNDLHVNFGKQIVYNTFDQNRFFLGLAYATNKTDNLQFGYMNVYQQSSTGNQYKSLNVARLFYFHNLDLRKTK